MPHVKAIINRVGNLTICTLSSTEVMEEYESLSLNLEVSTRCSFVAQELVVYAILDVARSRPHE